MQESADKAVAAVSVVITAARPVAVVGKMLEHQVEQLQRLGDLGFRHWFALPIRVTNATYHGPPLPLHAASTAARFDPGAVIRPVPGEWHPRMPEQLDEEELADWRAGRDAVYQLAALTIGARLAVADA
jgi:hypothetical protein